MSVNAFLRKHAPPGDEPFVRVDWIGPASYAQVGTTPAATGATVSNGDPVAASTLGVNMITEILPAVSWSGNFLVLPIRASATKWILKWISLVTGTCQGQSQTAYTEAVAGSTLSNEHVKLHITLASG